MQQLRVTYVAGVVPGKWIDRFSERYPQVQLSAERLDSGDGLALLDRGDTDVLFVRFPPGHSPRNDKRHVIALYEELEVICAAKDHDVEYYDDPVAEEQILEYPLLNLQDYPEAVGGLGMAMEVVASGAFVARMPMSIARLHARKDVIYRVIQDGQPTQIGVAWLAQSPRTEMIDEFIGVVRGRSANSSRQGSVREKQQQNSTKTKRAAKPAATKGGGKPVRSAAAQRGGKAKARKRR